ncbi:MAG: hypothetical protein KKA84_07365 [Bacteroidetes bacterium]|nr:hypothetical protein [Bacteroidota bacterium]
MPGSARKYLASAMNKVDSPEVYPLHRWLNPARPKSFEIEKFIPHLNNYIEVNLFIEKAELHYNCLFRFGKDNDETEYIFFSRVNTPPSFFILSKTDLHEITIPFAEQILSIDNYQSEVIFEINKIESIKLLSQLHETDSIDFSFTSPTSEDKLTEMHPVVSNISLLTIDDLMPTTQRSHNLNSELDLPTSEEYSELSLFQDLPMLEYKSFDITAPKIFSVASEKLDSLSKSGFENHRIDSESILKYLEPVYELSENLINDILNGLPKFQKEGAKFLFNSHQAYFNDQLELNKELQAVMALKMLLRVRAVKKVLIITSSFKQLTQHWIGDKKIKGIWTKNLKLYLPDFAYQVITNTDYKTRDTVFNSNIINLVTYDIFEEFFLKGVLDNNSLNTFDCIVFDDLDEYIPDLDSVRSIKSNDTAKYIWFLSDFRKDSVKNKVLNLINPAELKILGRDNNSIKEVSTGRYNFDYYLIADNKRKDLSVSIKQKGQETLDDLIGLGNLLRFRPNALQIFQEEQRLLNKQYDDCENSKVELLGYHLKRIRERGGNTIIYSQYENDGLSVIKEYLDFNAYNYYIIKSLDSKNDINTALNSLENRGESGYIFLTNLKPKNIPAAFSNINHIINFDNSYNPFSRWQLEEKVMGNNTLSVYNYFYSETIENSFRDELASQGLSEKQLFDKMPVEVFNKYFDESNWCKLFGIESEVFAGKTVKDINISSMKDLVLQTKLLLSHLGYNSIETSADMKDFSFTITACDERPNGRNDVIAKCYVGTHLTSEQIQASINDLNSNSGGRLFLIVTNGTTSLPNIILPQNFIILSGDKLKSLLNLVL